MNETESYIADQIRLRVWSGLASPQEVQDIITDILEEDADEEMLRELVPQECNKKAEAEKEWPDVTDCDRLAQVFEALESKGVIAIQNAGWDKSEAFHACLEAYRAHGRRPEMFGICYYTSQDVDTAVDGGGLYLGFSSTRSEDESTDAPRAGSTVKAELEKAGLNVEWDGDPASRIKVLMQWQLRRRT